MRNIPIGLITMMTFMLLYGGYFMVKDPIIYLEVSYMLVAFVIDRLYNYHMQCYQQKESEIVIVAIIFLSQLLLFSVLVLN